MNCCDANGCCQQGHGCPARETPVADNELPITMEDGFMGFDWVMRLLWTGFAWLGVFALLALIAFYFGYAK